MLRASFPLVFLFLSLPAQADDASRFRAMGPKGVDAAISSGVSDAVLDRVCEQHDCRASRLYWYTDLYVAQEESRKQKKPILSLRLLGNLGEELSCANSRFFRTLLYSDPAIASVLREKFILHWQSERPAPKITIDFGDGRKMVQTVTGNSIHYLLDSDGMVLDALPGLYSPSDFRQALSGFGKLFADVQPLRGAAREQKLADYHRAASSELEARWPRKDHPLPPVVIYAGSKGRVPARTAASLAMTKAFVEIKPIKVLQPDDSTQRKTLKELMDDPVWTKLGREQVDGVRLSKESEVLVRSKLAYDPSTGLERTPEETQKTLAALRLSIAIDGLRNDFVYRRALHAWLASGKPRRYEELNQRIYESLFLTPASDPWLGLKPEGVYTGIRGDGISVTGH